MSEDLVFENVILGYYDSYSGINSCIGLLTCTGEVWQFELEGFGIEDIDDRFRFGDLEYDDVKECINKGFFCPVKKWDAKWVNYLEHHLNSISKWNIGTNPNETPCVGGDMVRFVFVPKEGALFELGTLSASYNKIYSFIEDRNALGILNRFITDWTIFW